MKAMSILAYIAAFGTFIFFVLLPAIDTWNAIWGVGGIVFAILLMPIAILAYPIIVLVAGLATGLGGIVSVLGAFLCYAAMGLVFGLFVLGGWLSEKAETKAWEREQRRYATLPEISERNYVGNTKTRIFHRPDCYQAQQISYENEVWFESAADAIIENYEPCKLCNPELEQ